MKSLSLPIVVIGSLLAGCAAGPNDPTRQPADEVVYRTGSNIPVRDKTPLTQEEKDKQAEAAREIVRQIQTSGGSKGK